MRWSPCAPGPAGEFGAVPRGVILHGSRSGHAELGTAAEFAGTDGWAMNPDNDLSWHTTIGDDILSRHMTERQWGWNAFQASRVYEAAEFAQSVETQPISDAQVRAFCWWFATLVRKEWPTIPLHFPTHSEVEASGEILHTPSGKSDVFSLHSPQADELRARILARLASEYGITS